MKNSKFLRQAIYGAVRLFLIKKKTVVCYKLMRVIVYLHLVQKNKIK